MLEFYLSNRTRNTSLLPQHTRHDCKSIPVPAVKAESASQLFAKCPKSPKGHRFLHGISYRCFVEFRGTSLASIRTDSGRSPCSTQRPKASAARAPIRETGRCTVVRAGTNSSDPGRSSRPISETPSGTLISFFCKPNRVPIAITSDKHRIASGRSDACRILSTTSTPPLVLTTVSKQSICTLCAAG